VADRRAVAAVAAIDDETIDRSIVLTFSIHLP
jgi:hypothetical protein